MSVRNGARVTLVCYRQYLSKCRRSTCVGATNMIWKRPLSSSSKFRLDALPFSISPEEAMQKFDQWADEEQGLKWLLRYTPASGVSIGAAYVPVWAFDVNVRFKTVYPNRPPRYDRKPEPFASVYGGTDTIHLPGLGSYAGYNYRRSLVDPVHNTSLTFLADDVVPFASWMLRDMTYHGRPLPVSPDPWNATRSMAFSVVLDELDNLVQQQDHLSSHPPQVQTELLRARRVYMPTYVFSYRLLGVSFQAFLSGCDKAGTVSGVSHQLFSPEVTSGVSTFLHQTARNTAATAGPVGILFLLQQLGGLLSRILLRFPLVAAVSGTYVAFRKLIMPRMDQRTADAEWERQRDHESRMTEEGWSYRNDFVDQGGQARAYFRRNRGRILRSLGGEDVGQHGEGDFEWYKEWEQWARQQWTEQQRQQQQQQQQQQQWSQDQQRQQQRSQKQQQSRQQQQKKKQAKKDYKWDFDPNDPYAVLGIQRGATKTQVSQAFRREMLKHHPDTQVGSSEEARQKSLERSKLITEAYRKIKNQMK